MSKEVFKHVYNYTELKIIDINLSVMQKNIPADENV